MLPMRILPRTLLREALIVRDCGILWAKLKGQLKLTYGKPLDLSADVPVLPPLAMLMTVVCGCLLWKMTGRRLRLLPAPLSNLAFRVALLAAGLAMTKLVVFDNAAVELDKAGSRTWFVPVEGLATQGIYEWTRNPMYCGLIFFALPTLSMVLNTAWPTVVAPITWAYIHFVVIAAEETLLTESFGAPYKTYCSKVPRWLV